MTEHPQNTQSDEDIVRLDPIDHVRRRPGMYIGGTDEKALHHLIYETVDNAVELALAKKCNHIWIALRPNNEVSIQDNGPGMPTELNQTYGKSMLEVIMTKIGMGGRRIPIDDNYPISGGLHGVGLAAVNALSEWLLVESVKDGYVWKQEYRYGKPQYETSQEPHSGKLTGVSFTFRPDFTILEPNSFDYEKLAERCRVISYLVAGITLTLRDDRKDQPIEETFYAANGLVDLLKQLNQDRHAIHEAVSDHCKVLLISPQHTATPYTVVVDFALQFTDAMDFRVMSFVNTLEIPGDGLHIQALTSTLTNLINEQDHFREDDEAFFVDEAVRGLTVVMHILHPDPSFRSAMGLDLIIVPQLYGAICEATYHAGMQLLSDSRLARELVENCERIRYVTKGGIC